jgi:predicted transcriptional regulator
MANTGNPAEYTRMFTARIRDDEEKAFDSLAKKLKKTRSELLRDFINASKNPVLVQKFLKENAS